MSYPISNERIHEIALYMGMAVPDGCTLDEVIFAALWVAATTLPQNDMCKYSKEECFSILVDNVREKLIDNEEG